MRSILYLLILAALSASHSFARAPDPVWGIPKEGVVVGLWHTTNRAGNGSVAIYACQTTAYKNDLILPVNQYQTIEFVLKGTNNHPVKLTSEGRKFGQKLETAGTRSIKNKNHLTLLSRFGLDDPQLISRFDINQCFRIAEEADYELEIRLRLLKMNGTDDSKFMPVIFEPIKTRIHLLPSPFSDQ